MKVLGDMVKEMGPQNGGKYVGTLYRALPANHLALTSNGGVLHFFNIEYLPKLLRMDRQLPGNMPILGRYCKRPVRYQ